MSTLAENQIYASDYIHLFPIYTQLIAEYQPSQPARSPGGCLGQWARANCPNDYILKVLNYLLKVAISTISLTRCDPQPTKGLCNCPAWKLPVEGIPQGIQSPTTQQATIKSSSSLADLLCMQIIYFTSTMVSLILLVIVLMYYMGSVVGGPIDPTSEEQDLYVLRVLRSP